MKQIFKYIGNFVIFSGILLTSACDPVTMVIGGTAIAGTTAIRNQEGISGSISDNELQTRAIYLLLEKNKDISDRVELSVKHGMVIVIGYMKSDAQREEALRLVRSVKGFKEIFDETQVQEPPSAKNFAIDSSITSRIKSSLAFDGNVQSLNYDITTVKGVVYICGTAQSKYERDVVLNHARTTSAVKKVVAYIKINKN
ncbi:MAG: BON domain-containing protein [Holosporaceae bacterium]|nr:BON domain-containing protein [Holosporaceae bacterium]